MSVVQFSIDGTCISALNVCRWQRFAVQFSTVSSQSGEYQLVRLCELLCTVLLKFLVPVLSQFPHPLLNPSLNPPLQFFPLSGSPWKKTKHAYQWQQYWTGNFQGNHPSLSFVRLLLLSPFPYTSCNLIVTLFPPALPPQPHTYRIEWAWILPILVPSVLAPFSWTGGQTNNIIMIVIMIKIIIFIIVRLWAGWRKFIHVL